jgi:hypothetical protein
VDLQFGNRVDSRVTIGDKLTIQDSAPMAIRTIAPETCRSGLIAEETTVKISFRM